MTNAERLRANCLVMAGDDISIALDLACQFAVASWEKKSPGFDREDPQGSPAPHKRPPKPILTEGGK